MVSSVVVQLPGRPRLLAWMCTGCGSFSSSTAWATDRMICRGVTPKWSTGESMVCDVAGRPALPHLDAAGIDDLGGVRLRRGQEPADQGLDLLRLPLLDRPHQVMVIAHQDVKALVDARRVLRTPRGRAGRKGAEWRRRKPSCSPAPRTCSRWRTCWARFPSCRCA